MILTSSYQRTVLKQPNRVELSSANSDNILPTINIALALVILACICNGSILTKTYCMLVSTRYVNNARPARNAIFVSPVFSYFFYDRSFFRILHHYKCCAICGVTRNNVLVVRHVFSPIGIVARSNDRAVIF